MYAEELAFAVRCHKAIMYVAEKIQEAEVTYPDFVDFKELCLDGLERNIRTKCEEAPNGQCVIQTTAGGLGELLGLLEGLIDELTQEVDFGSITEREALADTEGDCDGEEEEAL